MWDLSTETIEWSTEGLAIIAAKGLFIIILTATCIEWNFAVHELD